MAKKKFSGPSLRDAFKSGEDGVTTFLAGGMTGGPGGIHILHPVDPLASSIFEGLLKAVSKPEQGFRVAGFAVVGLGPISPESGLEEVALLDALRGLGGHPQGPIIEGYAEEKTSDRLPLSIASTSMSTTLSAFEKAAVNLDLPLSFPEPSLRRKLLATTDMTPPAPALTYVPT